MAEKTNEKAPPAESTRVSKGGWDRFAEDAQKRPKYYVTLLVVAVAIIAAVVFGIQAYKKSQAEAESARVQSLNQALELSSAAERVTALRDLESDFKGENAAAYLITLARTFREAADEAETTESKINYYQQAIQTVDRLMSDHGDHPLVTKPWQLSTPDDGGPVPTVASRLRSFAEEQIAFLKDNPVPPQPKKDKGFTAKITLKDPDGNPKILTLGFFSSVAPHACATFARVARSGYYDGTKILAMEKTYDFSSGTQELVPQGVIFGSAMAKVAPEDPDQWFKPADDVGFTLPREKNTLEPKKGRVALQWIQNAFGSSPVQVMILIKDAEARRFQFDPRTLFGEVTEGLDVLDALAEVETTDDILQANISPLADPWTIESIEISGEPGTKPAEPILDPIKLPEPPKDDEEGK